MFETYRRLQRQRAAGEIDGGFTLIELLIVIVVLGILAAIVVFAVGGVTGKSAVAACQSDARTVGVGVAAFEAQNQGLDFTQLTNASGNGIGTWQYVLLNGPKTANVVGTTPVVGGPYVQTWPASSAYTISVYDGSTTPITLTGGPVTYGSQSMPSGTNYVVANSIAASTTPVVPAVGDVIVTVTNGGLTYDATQYPTLACINA